MNIATIQLPANINSADAISTANQLSARLHGGHGPVQVSLRGVNELDGSGMSAIYRIVANARQARRRVQLVNVSGSIRHQLFGYGLSHLLPRERTSVFERVFGRARLVAA